MTQLPTFDPGFSTSDMTAVFTSAATVAAMTEFESALALALVDVGLAPEESGRAVAAACLEPLDNPDEIVASTWDTGTPVIALNRALSARLDDDSVRWLHFGATTQDTVDTGRMLQCRSALSLLEASAIRVARDLKDFAVEHRDQPQMGRTFLQESRPTTFGARVAMWLAPLVEDVHDLRVCREGLMVQLGGPSGVLTDYGDRAADVVEAVARRLSLKAPIISWHTDRSPVWWLARAVETLALGMGKIGTDLALLAGFGEVNVRAGGSSSMPGKRNPLDAIRARAAASACSGFASMITGVPPNELDRGVGGWHVEWLALPMLFQTAAAAVEAVEMAVASLEVNADVMAPNVEEPVVIDPRIIDGVLTRYEEVIG